MALRARPTGGSVGRSLSGWCGAAAVVAIVAAVGACKGAGPPPTALTVPDSADQVLYGLEHNVTIDGLLRVRLLADTAYFYQGPQVADLFGVKVTFYSPEGRETSTITAQTGTYYWRTDNMEARGDVVAQTPDGRHLTTQILRYDRRSDRISGPGAFVFDAPDRHIEGDGFTADPDFRDVQTGALQHGRVRGGGGEGKP
jgi:LPS export ABC transporter protein LptC